MINIFSFILARLIMVNTANNTLMITFKQYKSRKSYNRDQTGGGEREGGGNLGEILDYDIS
jgi:hypothetical protein